MITKALSLLRQSMPPNLLHSRAKNYLGSLMQFYWRVVFTCDPGHINKTPFYFDRISQDLLPWGLVKPPAS